MILYTHSTSTCCTKQLRITGAVYNHLRYYYVYGVSLTHGQDPREHIWTFVGSLDESSSNPTFKCPCIDTNISPSAVPSYIGSDYFCDTAFSVLYYTVPNYESIQVSDPLWDGEGCGSTNICCYDPQREVNPPWFVKTLSSPTSDNIEMRLCHPYQRVR